MDKLFQPLVKRKPTSNPSGSTSSTGASSAPSRPVAKVVTVTKRIAKAAPPPPPPPIRRPPPPTKAAPSKAGTPSSPAKRKRPSSPAPASSSSSPRAHSSPMPTKKRRAVVADSSESESESDDEQPAPRRRQRSSTRASSPGTADERTTRQSSLDLGGWSVHGVVERNVTSRPLQPGDKQRKPASAKELVMLEIDRYDTYFKDLDDPKNKAFEWDRISPPFVEVLYPGEGSEEFPLLFPKDKDGYAPLSDLMTTIHLILSHFLPLTHSALFGFSPAPLSSSTRSPFAFLSPTPTPASTPPPTAPSAEPPVLRALQKALNRRDGPGFRAALERFNRLLGEMKEQGVVRRHVDGLKGMEESVVRHIGEQCYQRTVGPRVKELSNYTAFSSNVYGEILPPFVSHIIHTTALGPGKTFIDLGSGVGNVVHQVALEAGAEAWGVEQMDAPASMATRQLREAKVRWCMWGVGGGDMRCRLGDMCEEQWVADVLKRADVVLVNNYAFTSTLNERLSLLFLDLPDGAQVVSLRPFVPPHFRITDATVHSPTAILQPVKGRYYPGSVSWGDGGGDYYIQKVDRTKLRAYLERHPNGGGGPVRESRRRG